MDLRSNRVWKKIAVAKMGALYTEEDGRCWLDGVGKGSKPRRLPVSHEMLAAYIDSRLAYGLPGKPHRDDPTPLVLSTRGRQ